MLRGSLRILSANGNALKCFTNVFNKSQSEPFSSTAAALCSSAATKQELDTQLSSLITDLTSDPISAIPTTSSSQTQPPKSQTLRSIQSTPSLNSLKQVDDYTLFRAYICKKLNKPLSAETSVALLSRFSSLSFQHNSIGETAKWLESNFLTDLSAPLLKDTVRIDDIIVSLTSLISIGLINTPLYQSLLKSFGAHLSSALSSVPVSLLIRLAAAIRTHNVTLPDDLNDLLDRSLQLKTSEVDSTGDVISLLINVNLSQTWLEQVLERAKELLPLMSTGELVSLAANLANRGRRQLNILPLIAAAFHANPNTLTVNQLSTLVQSMSRLEFVDKRLLRRVHDDTISATSAGAVKKWSTLSTLAVSFAKLHIGDLRIWKALTNWVNANYKKATVSDLSYVISSCAISDVGDLIKEPSEYLASLLDVQKAQSIWMWLNIVHSLAICKALTPALAETVLRVEFVEHFTKLDDLPKKVFALSKIAQIQAVVDTAFKSTYKGPSFSLENVLTLDKQTNNAALLIKCGRKEAYDAECFHSVLYKLAPLNTHSIEPSLNRDGFLVDATVQLDSSKRFVPVTNFTSSNKPKIAVVYLGRKQCTITCDENEESRPLGQISLGLRLLKARGMIPVTFTELELKSNKLLSQKIEFIKTKLQNAIKSPASKIFSVERHLMDGDLAADYPKTMDFLRFGNAIIANQSLQEYCSQKGYMIIMIFLDDLVELPQIGFSVLSADDIERNDYSLEPLIFYKNWDEWQTEPDLEWAHKGVKKHDILRIYVQFDENKLYVRYRLNKNQTSQERLFRLPPEYRSVYLALAGPCIFDEHKANSCKIAIMDSEQLMRFFARQKDIRCNANLDTIVTQQQQQQERRSSEMQREEIDEDVKRTVESVANSTGKNHIQQEASATATTNNVEDEVKFEDVIPECVICRERNIDVVFLPCRHAVCCMTCKDLCCQETKTVLTSPSTKQRPTCPICRTELGNFGRIWFSKDPDCNEYRCRLCGCNQLTAAAGGNDGCGCVIGCYEKAVEMLHPGDPCPICGKPIHEIIQLYLQQFE
ncbi:unnamed protein product [Anisakis simplex]|uniref:RING-type domain-containing protein n=1 Tax=Anisakis simplex TaxID=6269 RepID=A0A158PNX4_ANISI|nr:unnamed protein product [Anisakis simplex]